MLAYVEEKNIINMIFQDVEYLPDEQQWAEGSGLDLSLWLTIFVNFW